MIRQFKKGVKIKLLQKFGCINRITLAAQYLSGEGIEIGAMDMPQLVKAGVKVRYLDRISREASAKIFPEIAKKLVDVDIIDDGETLQTISDAKYDFIIGNHFIEHCQNPLFTIQNMLRVVRKGGRIFMAIPDKRYTFDEGRAITTLDHFIKDYEQGPAWSEQEHYLDFVRHTYHGENKREDELPAVIEELKQRNFSIHFHVWDHQAMIDMFCMMQHKLGFSFEVEVAITAQNGGNESIFILRK